MTDNNEVIINNSSNGKFANESVTAIVSPTISPMNGSLIIPPNDQIINSINWSKYPIIGYHYISHSYVAEPNDVINHSFKYTSTEVEIKSPDNVLEVYKEMSSIVKAERTILGPNSAPELWGHIEGAGIFHVGMLPYSSEIYRRDYYHPVNNLTWSDIDASEIE